MGLGSILKGAGIQIEQCIGHIAIKIGIIFFNDLQFIRRQVPPIPVILAEHPDL